MGVVRRRATILVAALWLVAGGCGDQENAGEPAADERRDAAAQLRSLPYVTRAKVREENRGLRGVVHHQADRVQPGLNPYGSSTRSKVHLRGMSGEVVHAWDGAGLLHAGKPFLCSRT